MLLFLAVFFRSCIFSYSGSNGLQHYREKDFTLHESSQARLDDHLLDSQEQLGAANAVRSFTMLLALSRLNVAGRRISHGCCGRVLTSCINPCLIGRERRSVAMVDTELSSLTLKVLKEKAKDAGLKVSGSKAELVARLSEHSSGSQQKTGGDDSQAIRSEPIDLSSLKLSALKQKAKDAGLKVSGSKAELVARLSTVKEDEDRGSSTHAIGASESTSVAENIQDSISVVPQKDVRKSGSDHGIYVQKTDLQGHVASDDGRTEAQDASSHRFRKRGKIASYFGVANFLGGKGDGVITPDDGTDELHFNTCDIRMENGFSVALNVGQSVEYSHVNHRNGKGWAKHVTSPGYEYVQAPPRHTGTIAYYSEANKYGSIRPDDGGADLFLHWSNVRRQNDCDVRLKAGDAVEYFAVQNLPGTHQAVHVTSPLLQYVLEES